MAWTTKIRRFALVAGVTTLLGQVSEARVARVDFGDTNFANSGEIFNTSDTTFGTGSGSMLFDLNFGSGAQRYDYCFNGNGFVSFVVSGGTCGLSGAPTGDYVAPFLSTLTTGGNTLSSFGLVDSVHSGSALDPFVVASATSAYRFIWDATDTAGNRILTELLLLDKGAGNFGLIFEYGSPLFGIDGAPATGQQIVHLGTNVAGPTNGPFPSTTDYTYSVVNGVCATCTGGGTVTVPEPSTLLLMSCGLLMLPFLRRRRNLLNFPAA